ncbi:TrmH family RNA methyltransferase [Tahibacter harae]|uniref:rRNA methyltransferase n=1 Tax=Tahibacter harae TaxID=2963937 RepID=A0ABT1QQH6_9GAMM|nr:TrmH family RNA methyltransferase [Tahibacter harae]MCQ4164555.1 rRNA methyltransferase [Tahibacter harae]
MNSHDDDSPRRGPPDSPWSSARPRSGQARPDKRERERLKAAGQGRPPRDAAYAPRAPQSYAPRSGTGARRSDEQAAETAPRPELQQRHEELRLFGINACKAAFAARPQDLRKAYLTEQRIAEFKPLLAWCVKHRLGYRVVEEADLARLSASQHHEGICLEMRRQNPLGLAELLTQQPPAPQPSLLVVLDGVGNPHNFGAVLRSAANFAVGGIVVPADSSLGLSGAACRVAEGGAEAVALARPQPGEDLLALLRASGYAVAATVPRDGVALYRQPLPARLALIFGAENEGMSAALIQAADLRLQIPGSGKVESLNIAASAAVLFAEHYRQHLVS